MQTTMTVKGQVTIPKAVREIAGLRPGSRIEVENADNGEVVLRAVNAPLPLDPAQHRQDMLARVARAQALFDEYDQYPGMTADEHMAIVREPFEPTEFTGTPPA